MHCGGRWVICPHYCDRYPNDVLRESNQGLWWDMQGKGDLDLEVREACDNFSAHFPILDVVWTDLSACACSIQSQQWDILALSEDRSP